MIVVGAAPLAIYAMLRYNQANPVLFAIAADQLHIRAAASVAALRDLVLLAEVVQSMWILIPEGVLAVVLIGLLYPLGAWLRPGARVPGLRVPLTIGLVGGGFYAAMAPLLWASLDAGARDPRLTGSLTWLFVQSRIVLPVVLIQATVAVAVVVAGGVGGRDGRGVAAGRRAWVPHAVLAAIVTGAVQTAAYLVGSTMHRCWSGWPTGGACLRPPSWAVAFQASTQFMVTAPLFAMLAAAGTAGVLDLARRFARRGAGLPPRLSGRPARALVAGGLAALVVLVSVVWLGSRTEPAPGVVAAEDRDPCLVGVWAMRSTRVGLDLTGIVPGMSTVVLSGPVGLSMGEQVEFRRDGTAASAIDLIATDGEPGAAGTHAWEVRGLVNFRWEGRAGTYRFIDAESTALTRQIRSGADVVWHDSDTSPDLPDASMTYTCGPDSLALTGPSGEDQYVRISG